MSDIANLSSSELDEHFLRRSFAVARRAVINGNHPFGAILVDHNRNVLIEAENGYMPAHDGTAHANACWQRRPARPSARNSSRTRRCIHPPNPARCARAPSIGPALAAWFTA